MKEAILGVTDNDLANHCISAAVRIICSSRIPSIFALLGSLPEGWLEIDKHYSLELCFSIEKQPETVWRGGV